MRRGSGQLMAGASGAYDEASIRLQNMDSTEEPSVNGIFGKGKRSKAVEDGRTSSSQSTVNLVNCILGAGVLGYPFCFRSCGLLLGTLIMLVSIAASRFSYDLLLYCSQISNKRTYEELAEEAVGKIGRQIVQLCTAALNLGCIVAYLNILADVLSAVAGTIIPPGAEPSRNAYITGVSILGALPVALWVRDHGTIVTFMMASVGFVILFAVVVVIFSMAPHPVTAAGVSSVALWQPDGLLVAFPVIVYSFTAHPYFLGIFNNLHSATFTRMSHVTNVAMGLSGALYWIVGVFGYLTFRNRTAGDLLRNFGAANVEGMRGAYERAIKLCYGLSILGSVPLVILPFYNLMLPLLGFKGPGDGMGLSGIHVKRSSSGGEAVSMEDSAVADSSGRGPSYSSSPATTPVGGATNVVVGSGRSRSLSSRPSRTGSQQVDVVDLKLHADRDRDRDGGEGEQLGFGQHAFVVMIVLGTALATAIWVPNIEFIFGLTGATASVLLSYILPAITFIRLMDLNPELLGGGNFKVIPEAIRSQWLWRKRKAIALLCFGVVSGITCTDAILGAVQQEAAVVYLAQQLVAHEVVVAETAIVQQKARAAVTAMSAVELASKELGQAGLANATGTFNRLQQAAEQLDVIAGAAAESAGNDNGGGEQHSVGGSREKGKDKKSSSSQQWGLQTLVKGHKQHAAETKVYKAVEQALTEVKDELRRTAASVAEVITQLDTTITQLKSDASSGTAATENTATAAEQATGMGLVAGGTSAAGSTAGSSSTSSSGTSSKADSSGTGSMRDRANDLAQELGKALGAFSDVAVNVTVAGKSLSQVRSTAVSTLIALNQTISVLDHVSAAVEAAKKSHKHDDEIKKTAAVAMRLALNATATSALAMQLTGEALERSATEEASELLGMLVQVSRDLEKTSTRAKVAKAKRLDNNNTAMAAAAANTDSALGATANAADFSSAETNGKGGGGGAAVVSTDSGGGASGTAGTTLGFGEAAAKIGGDAVTAAVATAAASGRKSGRGKGDRGKRKDGHTSSGSSGTAVESSEGALVEIPKNATGSDQEQSDVQSPADKGAHDAAEVAAGQLEQVIKDLNSTITAAGAATNAAATIAAAASISTSGKTDASTTVTSSSNGALVNLSDGGSGEVKEHTEAASTAAAMLTVNSTAGLGAGLNVSGIAAVLQEAVAATKVKQDEALQEIQHSLTSANVKVVERVVGIAKDLSVQKSEASLGKGVLGSSTAGGTVVEPLLINAGGEVAAAAAVVAVAGGLGASDDVAATTSGGHTSVDSTLLSLVHTATENGSGANTQHDDGEKSEDPGSVVGPVVKVDVDGHLIQEDGDGDGVVGPTIKEVDMKQQHEQVGDAASAESRVRKTIDVAKAASDIGAQGNGSSEESGGSAGGGVKLRKLGLGLDLATDRAG